MKRTKDFGGRCAVVVLDGWGVDPAREWTMVDELWRALPQDLRDRCQVLLGDPNLARAALAPLSHGVAKILSEKSNQAWNQVFPAVRLGRSRLINALGAETMTRVVDRLRKEIAEAFHYAPWAVDLPFLYDLRQSRPTYLTRTAGVFTGQEDLEPEIMGNSDTGHQQIFNLTVARQIPRALADLIRSGEFYRNEALNEDLRKVVSKGGRVVFKTLLSGQHGDDGYVHSAWPHMEAFFELYFRHLGLPGDALSVEAVLDGRDSPSTSSLNTEVKDGKTRYGFLHALLALLDRYNARGSLKWILGRQFMDRDYKGGMIKVEYEALVSSVGRHVASVEEAFNLVAGDHAGGLTDPMVPPVIIGTPTPVDGRSLFFNAIFRADRQEPITAALLGARSFITRQATQKKKLDTWEDFTWMKELTGLKSWSMIQYHKEFEGLAAKAVFHDQPHPHNVLHLLTEAYDGFRFLFLTEGVKEKHMGLFSRGRRSTPLASETQRIVSSYGRESGVASDNELFLFPAMRHPEIGKELVSALNSDEFDVVATNFPGPDMIGHLVENHFDACKETLLSLESVLRDVMEAASRNGWVVLLTSDHGNVEHFGPDHGNNDVLTSVVLPEGNFYHLVPPHNDSARLFDVAWTLLEVLRVPFEDLSSAPIPEELARDSHRLVGSSLLHRKV